jgi:hypothetical protein
MRTKRKEPVRVEERVVDGPTHCDVCKVDVKVVEEFSELNEVTIEARIGPLYDDGSSDRDAYELDVCKVCFVAKVIPALAAAGIHVRKRHEQEDERVWEDEVTKRSSIPDPDPIF